MWLLARHVWREVTIGFDAETAYQAIVVWSGPLIVQSDSLACIASLHSLARSDHTCPTNRLATDSTWCGGS